MNEIKKSSLNRPGTHFTFYKGDGNKRRVLGIDFGYKGILFIEALPNGDEIWKTPGSQGWAGIGMTSYYSTRYYLVEILRKPNSEQRGRMRFIWEGEFGTQWRAGLQALREKQEGKT